jgi:hypothetical protein
MAQISTANETIVPMAVARGKSRKPVFSSNLFFSLGERSKLLNEILNPPEVCDGDSYPVERLLRSFFQCLIDDVTAETAFVTEFFEDANIAIALFAPVTKYIEQFLDEILAKITDPICIVLLLRFSLAHKAEMERRSVRKIDQHLTNVHRALTSRFRQICATNLAAIENADLSRILENEVTAHHANSMTRRFAEFAASLSVLTVEDLASLIPPELHAVAAAVIDLLEKTARGFRTADMGMVFLINNYFLIFSTLRGINGCVLIELFEQKLSDCTAHFVDLELYSNFKKLVETVRRAFTKLETREDPLPIGIGESELKEIAMEFRQNHSDKIKNLAEGQLMKFGDFMNGREILKMVAKRLVLYWAKFDQLCRSVVKNAPWLSNLMSTQQLVYDIRPMTERDIA